MDQLINDLRFALRMIRNSPGFTAVAVLTLALGIGANTAIFSFVDAVLLKPLPYPHPEELVMVWEKPPQGERNGISTLNFLDWKNQNTVFTAMAAETGGSVTLTGVDKPVQLRGSRVSARFFDILGVKPMLGRTFAPDEDQLGEERVVILSHRIWESRFGADPSIVGRSISLDSQPHTVIGVNAGRKLVRPGLERRLDTAGVRTQGHDPELSLDDLLGQAEAGSDDGAGAVANEVDRSADRA